MSTRKYNKRLEYTYKYIIHAMTRYPPPPPHRLPPFATEQSARLQKESFTQLEDALLALNMERSQVCITY